MTALQMRLAVSEIHQGKTFTESLLPKNEKNRQSWMELSEEINHGFSIDNQSVRICFNSDDRIVRKRA
ncbi:MAG: hypothetical protein HKN09_10635 [Saprospiraceae bacterium]|nr:hypothetical protein [Saprospiraceae bacterium]